MSEKKRTTLEDRKYRQENPITREEIIETKNRKRYKAGLPAINPETGVVD